MNIQCSDISMYYYCYYCLCQKRVILANINVCILCMYVLCDDVMGHGCVIYILDPRIDGHHHMLLCLVLFVIVITINSYSYHTIHMKHY